MVKQRMYSSFKMPFSSWSSISDADSHQNTVWPRPNWTNMVMLEMQKKKKYSILSNLSLETHAKQFVTDKVPASE